jgi:hypothetical protein
MIATENKSREYGKGNLFLIIVPVLIIRFAHGIATLSCRSAPGGFSAASLQNARLPAVTKVAAFSMLA